MPSTTTKGWPYVLPADNVADYPTTSQGLANMLDSVVPFAMAAGITPAWTSLAPGIGASIVYSLPAGRFTATPAMAVTPDSSGYLAGSIGSATATGFSARMYNISGSSISGMIFRWIAVQMTATTGPGLLVAEDFPTFVGTCRTPGCGNEGVALDLPFDPDDLPLAVICGVCNEPINELEGLTL